MPKLMFTKKTEVDDQAISWQESEVWVADFGSPEIEQLLKQEVVKLKPKEPTRTSWIFSALALLVILVGAEYLLLYWSNSHFWQTSTVVLVTWLWRLVALMIWLYFGQHRGFPKAKNLAVAFVSFVAATLVIGVIKIIYIQSIWVWLNLLVEPFWTIIFVAIFSWFYFKLKNSPR